MATATMYLRGVRQRVVREAKALAAREGITLTALVQRALEKETRSARPVSSRVAEIAGDIDWYEANKAALVDRFEGQCLAIIDREVVDHDHDAEALAARVAERFGSRSVYMPLCQRGPRTAVVRSPRIAG